ncbi:aldo/keto reductase [Afipia carboxidovorans OM5]|uniref:Putative oxidoreductase n=1 Tax=Afipia carboxidovorans (strain ATCC 49405 / DSM 1227 / KCTC 32145 / OM5) TaxID=504832 RepID=B6JGP2_AFIC5|nr:aldo/keto reductase [Afipia carboxidovorans]ACI93842.1 aldo/keto reductase [Afipia carboxidovorans OM5]AEI02480.1 putative oxidoreductase [Afipia carboxidovorans OM4]AEI06056.1 putative oxidoreductase [Afipia carboxidovorans OM5]
MEYVKFGKTGLKVSRLWLGCMTYGTPDRGQHPWTMPEDASRPLIKQALELGINVLDTANTYSDGTSEEIIGRAVKDFARRDEVIITSKVCLRMRDEPNGAGLSRKAIFTEVNNSLRRLGTDYIDLYQIHRWDYDTPIEETLEALNDIVRAGKVRYIGASSMHAWQFAKALYTSRLHGWSEFVSMQDHLNLLYREEEREMLPLCLDQGIAVVPWSPLARGRLTREWDDVSERTKSDVFGRTLYTQAVDADKQIVAEVARIAKARGVPRAQVALAWVIQKRGVTAPIIGASKPQHLTDAVAALSLNLTDEEIKALEAPYIPHRVSGHQ